MNKFTDNRKTYVSKSTQCNNSKFRLRNRKYFDLKRRIKKIVSSSVINDQAGDNRLYAKVVIAGQEIRGLLDSGASITVLGSGSEEFLSKLGVHFYHNPSSLSTASGEKQRIFGHIKCFVLYGDKKHMMRIFIAPGLKQKLYLGIDFWKLFGLEPKLIDEIDSSSVELDTIKNRHILTSGEENKLESIINIFPSFAREGLGKTNLTSHVIDVGTAKPVKQRHYSVSPAVQADLDAEIDRMLSLGVIEVSVDSPWSSPVTLVKKANGKVRLCLDARKLNEVTVKDAYPLPIIDGLISRLEKTRFISSVDLKDAFWQIPLDKDSRAKTAFTVPGRPLYQFTVMPFGLSNAPQRMCRLMHRVIPHDLHDRLFVYLDDLLIISATLEEHFFLLEKVAQLLRHANLTINVEKSKFVMKEIKYLGYIVGDGCLKVDSSKVEAIGDFRVPQTKKQVRRFIGMTGWYRRFIKNYSTIAAPLMGLTSKNKKWLWNDECQKAFDDLKLALTEAPVLKNPDFGKPFFIQCDASKTGIGSVLFQISEEGEENPIAYTSKKLNAAQRNYSITELECYAAVHSVKIFRPYIEGYRFTILTDHASLKWLMEHRDLTGRLARWSLKLQAFDFTIEHRKGSQNVVPDALSRIHMEELESETNPIQVDLNSSAFLDDEYTQRLKDLRGNTSSNSNLREDNGKLLICLSGVPEFVNDITEWKLVIPNSLIESFLSQAHNPPSSAHFGVAKTLERLQRFYFWPSMVSDVRSYIQKCQICKTCKPMNQTLRPPMGKFVEVDRPFQRLYIDFLGPYPRSRSGNTSLFMVLDQFSRFILLKPMRRPSANNVVEFLEHEVFSLFSVPEIIFSDNGVQFTSVLFKDLLRKYGVKHTLTPKYSPQANASERVNRTILSAIRGYLKPLSHEEWDKHIYEIASALRNVVHSSTKFSPHFLVFGEHKLSHGSEYDVRRLLNFQSDNHLNLISKSDRLNLVKQNVLKYLKEAYEKNATRYNLRSRYRKFEPGQIVFVRNFTQSDKSKNYCAKLSPQFIKAKILKPVGNVAFEVVQSGTNKSMGVYHIKDIRNF